MKPKPEVEAALAHVEKFDRDGVLRINSSPTLVHAIHLADEVKRLREIMAESAGTLSEENFGESSPYLDSIAERLRHRAANEEDSVSNLIPWTEPGERGP